MPIVPVPGACVSCGAGPVSIDAIGGNTYVAWTQR